MKTDEELDATVDEGAEEGQPRRTPVAEEVESLRSTIFASIAKRQRLPQPLFWSLFRSRIDSIRRTKALRRAADEILDVSAPPPSDEEG